MEKDALRNRLFERYFEVQKGIKAIDFVSRLAFIYDLYHELNGLCEKNIEYFDCFVTADDVERIKPHPDLFNQTIKSLNIDKEELLVFEDSLNGLLSSEKAGIKTVIFPNPVTEHLDFTGANKIYKNMSEIALEDLLKQF